MANSAGKLSKICAALDKLKNVPEYFNQLERAERLESIRALVHQSSTLFNGVKERDQEKKVLDQCVLLFHRAIGETYPANFTEAFRQLAKGDIAKLPMALEFLEADPWFFRSGYIKADLIKYVLRMKIPLKLHGRFQQTILYAIDFRDRREFRWFCKLARLVNDRDFLNSVEQRLCSPEEGVRRRARWVLSAITHNRTFH